MHVSKRKVPTDEKLRNYQTRMDAILEKCRKIVGVFSHSSQATTALLKAQSAIGMEVPVKLVQDCVTRW